MTDPALQKLIDAELAGLASGEESADLAARIKSDPDAARAYVRATFTHAQLRQTLGRPAAPAITDAAPDQPDSFPIFGADHEPDTPSESQRSTMRYAFAAALLAACGIAIYLLAFNAPTDPQPDPTSSAPVATLIETTGNLTTPEGFVSEGEDYPSGAYALDAGSAEFMLTNAVNVKLRGDTRLRMHNNMHASLDRGVADFVVPPNASGYTVIVPDGTRILDIGTRFSVWVDDDGRAFTSVREGHVEIHANDQITPVVAGETWQSHRGAVTKIDNTTHLTAAADTIVSWGLPDRAFGDREVFQVRTVPHKSSGQPHAIYVGLIRFDIDSVLGDVDSATLSLAVGRDKNTDTSPRVDQDIDVYLLPNKLTWDEATITWRSAPDVVRRNGKGLDHLGRFTVPRNAQTNDSFDLDDPRLTDAIRRRVANGKKSVTLVITRAAPVDREVFLAFQSHESVANGGTAPTLTIRTDPRTRPRTQ